MAVLRALGSGASGLNAQQLKADILANNLANVNTPGFKKGRAEFSELVSQAFLNYGIPVAQENEEAAAGSGVRVAQAARIFKPGAIVETGRPLDLAVSGEGFFKVLLPGGEERYTRDGSFSPDPEGYLVTPSGARLEGIQLAPGTAKVTVTPEGLVSAEGPAGPAAAGQITLYRFTSVNGLRGAGGGLFEPAAGAGEAISGAPGSQGFGTVRQGCLEMANVDLVEELAGLMEAQRAYGFNARAVRTVDEMWGMANNMRK
ncbi:MAG: flagellar hook-basal body protein [Peptococcaceae bacterium]|nr:flagellar hook-basal body protein [Peptococcaceae bacterium]